MPTFRAVFNQKDMIAPTTEPYEHFLTDQCSFKMAKVKSGQFLMGSQDEDAYDNEKILHLVHLDYDFYMGIFPVTQKIWATVMEDHEPSYFKGAERPVEQVSWQDIRTGGQDDTVPTAFLDRLNQFFRPKNERFKNHRFRLPSEAEWEYAAKGGHLAPPIEDGRPKHSYFKYAGSYKLKEVAWFNTNAHNETKEVGLKVPNQLGLYDMCGNVLEWCEDDWNDSYEGALDDGKAWIKADRENTSRVIRGGSWGHYLRFCRVAGRGNVRPSGRGNGVGFRLVLSL